MGHQHAATLLPAGFLALGVPHAGPGAAGGLGGVHGRAGAFDVDPAALERANAALARLNKGPNYDHLIEEEKKEEDGRTMLQVMQDKRRAAEESVAAAKAN